ncbi:stalk domain-containing protein [Paenibacillus senegalensis]|uniref:stalk domain-containing protein n=1 Tax=Paenibacillus senegalensis TaxID=1465766 RepID=UPI000288E365|nr:stalk domain-containing protein [Paenibacillus senegalensis]
MRKQSKFILIAMMASFLSSQSVYAVQTADAITDSSGSWMSSVQTIAGTGSFGARDGDKAEASFRHPSGLAAAPDGTLYVSDTKSHLLRRLDHSGVSLLAGSSFLQEDGQVVDALGDGKGELSSFSEPAGLALDHNGNLFVADKGNHAVRKVDAEGNVTTYAGQGVLGHKDGTAEESLFYAPEDVVVASDGTVYVADTLNHVIRKIDPEGKVSTLNALPQRYIEVFPGEAVLAGDYKDGPLQEAKFNEPTGLAIDHLGNLYISDTGNRVIRYMDLANDRVSTVAGSVQLYDEANSSSLYASGGFSDGHATEEALFMAPRGIAITEEGGLVIADSLNHAIRYLFEGRVITLAGGHEAEHGQQDGINGYNRLNHPQDVQVAADGSIIIADAYNNQLRAFQLYQLPADLSADGRLHVMLDQEQINFDPQPELTANTSMIPVRAISEAAGFEVGYEHETRTVTIAKDNRSISLQIGSREAALEIAGQEPIMLELSVAPYIASDSTYVPVRFVAEALGLDVQWHQPTRTAILRHVTF